MPLMLLLLLLHFTVTTSNKCKLICFLSVCVCVYAYDMCILWVYLMRPAGRGLHLRWLYFISLTLWHLICLFFCHFYLFPLNFLPFFLNLFVRYTFRVSSLSLYYYLLWENNNVNARRSRRMIGWRWRAIYVSLSIQKKFELITLSAFSVGFSPNMQSKLKRALCRLHSGLAPVVVIAIAAAERDFACSNWPVKKRLVLVM